MRRVNVEKTELLPCLRWRRGLLFSIVRVSRRNHYNLSLRCVFFALSSHITLSLSLRHPWHTTLCGGELPFGYRQALFREAERNPPLLSRVLARLDRDDTSCHTTHAGTDGIDHHHDVVMGDATLKATSISATAPAPTSTEQSQLLSSSGDKTSGRDSHLREAHSPPATSSSVSPSSGEGVGVVNENRSGGATVREAVGGGGAAGGVKGAVRGPGLETLLLDRLDEEEAFAQDLINATVLLEERIEIALEQLV